MSVAAVPAPSRRFHAGVVLPSMILLLFLADGVSRLVPLRVFAFRGWEALLHSETDPNTVFAPSQHVHSPRAFGDLASMANRRDLREYHVEDFTTDALGFRDPPGLAESGSISVLLQGNSFAAGSGVSDDDTLRARLTQRLGVGVYTVAGVPTPTVADVHALLPRLRMQHGVLLYAYLQGYALKGPAEQTRRAYRFEETTPFGQITETVRISRLAIVARELKKWIRRDWHEEGVVARKLRTGETMLFPLHDVTAYRNEVPPKVDEWVWLARALAAEGLDLVVVLIPDKFAVYAPLLLHPEPPPAMQRLDALETLLRTNQIPVINLTATFQVRAAEELSRGGTIYWKDDTHWNAEGIAIAADEIARRWPAVTGTSVPASAP